MILQRRQIIIIFPIIAAIFLGLISYSYLSLSPSVAGPPEKQFEGPGVYVQAIADDSGEPISDLKIRFASMSSPNDLARVPGVGGRLSGTCSVGRVDVEVVVEPLEPVEPPPGCISGSKVTDKTGWIVFDPTGSQLFLLSIYNSDYSAVFPESGLGPGLKLADEIIQVDEESVYVRIGLPSGKFRVSIE